MSRFGCVLLLLAGLGLLVPGCERAGQGPGDLVGGMDGRAPGGGEVHLVRLSVDGDRLVFEPAEVRIRPGDAVRFVQTSHHAQAVSFDTADLPEEARSVLVREGAVRGPLLTGPGAIFEVSFQDAPPGAYPYRSPGWEAAGGMGTVVVGEEG